MIYVDPILGKTNAYSSIQVEALKSSGDDVSAFHLKLFFNFTLTKNDRVVLNWPENTLVNQRGNLRFKGLVKAVLILLGVLFCSVKVIWVKHNHKPHSSRGLSYIVSIVFMKMLNFLADTVVVHSKGELIDSHYFYVPHPLYTDNIKVFDSFGQPSRFLVFGAIKEYKGIDKLLKYWPKGVDLCIYGSGDSDYITLLEEIVKQRELSVNIINGFVNDDDLNDLLLNFDVVVLPHNEGSAIVSGAFFLAKSFGNLILIRGRKDINFFSDNSGVFQYEDERSLFDAIDAIEAISDDMPSITRSVIWSGVQLSNSQEVHAQAWREVV
jgi:glycosyltransferase involved in cell wall biosynthesis